MSLFNFNRPSPVNFTINDTHLSNSKQILVAYNLLHQKYFEPNTFINSSPLELILDYRELHTKQNEILEQHKKENNQLNSSNSNNKRKFDVYDHSKLDSNSNSINNSNNDTSLIYSVLSNKYFISLITAQIKNLDRYFLVPIGKFQLPHFTFYSINQIVFEQYTHQIFNPSSVSAFERYPIENTSFKYKDITSFDWMIKNQHYKLLLEKIKRNEFIHISPSSMLKLLSNFKLDDTTIFIKLYDYITKEKQFTLPIETTSGFNFKNNSNYTNSTNLTPTQINKMVIGTLIQFNIKIDKIIVDYFFKEKRLKLHIFDIYCCIISGYDYLLEYMLNIQNDNENNNNSQHIDIIKDFEKDFILLGLSTKQHFEIAWKLVPSIFSRLSNNEDVIILLFSFTDIMNFMKQVNNRYSITISDKIINILENKYNNSIGNQDKQQLKTILNFCSELSIIKKEIADQESKQLLLEKKKISFVTKLLLSDVKKYFTIFNQTKPILQNWEQPFPVPHSYLSTTLIKIEHTMVFNHTDPYGLYGRIDGSLRKPLLPQQRHIRNQIPYFASDDTQLSIIESFYEKIQDPILTLFVSVLNGHINIFRYLYEQLQPQLVTYHSKMADRQHSPFTRENLLAYSIVYGHFDVSRYIVDHLFDDQMKSEVFYHLISKAPWCFKVIGLSNDISIFKIVFESIFGSIGITPQSEKIIISIFKAAWSNLSIQLVEYLLDTYSLVISFNVKSNDLTINSKNMALMYMNHYHQILNDDHINKDKVEITKLLNIFIEQLIKDNEIEIFEYLYVQDDLHSYFENYKPPQTNYFF